LPVARAKDHRNDDRLSSSLPFHRARHFAVVAIVGREEVRANKEQNDVIAFDVPVDSVREVFARSDAAVMPCLDHALALEHRKLRFDLIPQRLVDGNKRKGQ